MKKKILKLILILSILFLVADVYSHLALTKYAKIIDNKTNKIVSMADVIESSQKGKRFKPNLDLTVYNAWISHWSKLSLKTNSLGLRGDEIDPQNPKNEFRILVLGDSITWAGYLPEEETYIFQLQRLLNQPAFKNIRTINAGIGDVGITEEVGLLKEMYDSIKPKTVILAFYLNDSRPPFGFESEKKLGWAKFLQKSRIINVIYNNVQVQLYLMRHKILGENYRYRWLYLSKDAKWKYDKEYFKEMVKEADLDWGAAWDDSTWAIVKNQIEELNRFSNKKGIKLLIVCLPVSFQVYAEFLDDSPQAKLMDIAKKKDIPFLDMLPILRKNKNAELFYDHCHLNVQGQRIVAQDLAEFITANKIVSR